MSNKFMIHFSGSVYSNELYDMEGKRVDTLQDAIDAAETLYPQDAWEVYNGDEGYMNEAMQKEFE